MVNVEPWCMCNPNQGYTHTLHQQRLVLLVLFICNCFLS